MSGLDAITSAISKVGENSGMLAAVSQVASMFENVPAIGALGRAAATLAVVDGIVKLPVAVNIL
jgi:Cricket paralysis virus, VP4